MSFRFTALALGVVFFAATDSALAQRMGHSNTHAPELAQQIKIAGKSTIKMSYVAITWANGTWAAALADKNKRSIMRERINAAAAEQPLGTFEVDTPTTVAGKHIKPGAYSLGFTIDKKFAWQITLRGATTIEIPLPLRKRAKEKARLILRLDPAETEKQAVLSVAFGDQGCDLEIVPELAAAPKPSFAGLINGMCPFMEDDEVDPKFTVSHTVNKKTHKIGLCCKDCIEDWDKLSGGDRDKLVARLLATKSKGG